MDVLEVVAPVLERLEHALAPWMRTDVNLAVGRRREVLLDVVLPGGSGEELLHPLGRRKARVAETPETESRCCESLGVDERVALVG